MSPDELIRLAVEMREAQREYFRTRDRDALKYSKALEQRFDREAKAYLHGPEEPKNDLFTP